MKPPSETKHPEAATDTLRMLTDLRALIRRSARRWKRLILLEAAGLAVAIPLAWLWLVFILDNLWHLPLWIRLGAAALFLAGVLRTAWRLAGRFRQARFTEDQVALAIERETGASMQNRMINAVQIPRGISAGGSDEFTAALLRENYDRLLQAELRQASGSRRALMAALAALLVTVAGAGFWHYRRDHFSNAAARLFMPFAGVDPIYRTVLDVYPGHTNALPGRDVAIRIAIQGRRPEALSIIRMTPDRRDVDTLAVPAGADQVAYLFRNLESSVTYAVSGGDFTTPAYTISVLTLPRLQRMQVDYDYPEYTGKAADRVERATGDLEALFGTVARVVYQFDQPVADAAMLIETSANEATVERMPLTRLSETEFEAELTLRDQRAYRLETRRPGRAADIGPPQTIRVVADQPPRLRLGGVDRSADVMPDSALPLSVEAQDDYGMLDVGLFMRATSDAPAESDVDAPPWQAIRDWRIATGAREFQTNMVLLPTALDVVEGETIELALRARDTDPLRDGAWVDGEVYRLRLTDDSIALQIRYEAILRAESALESLIEGHQTAIRQTAALIQSLDPAAGRRWDDAATLEALADELRTQTQAQASMRQAAARVARDMPSAAGNIRVAIGMLADTEMVRTIRILESVPERDAPASIRAGLSDARLTLQRTVRSLSDLHDRFVEFRRDWELANMIPFTGMLVERQTAMERESRSYHELPPDFDGAVVQRAAARRQRTLARLCGLAHTAFDSLADWLASTDDWMAQAFDAAAAELRDEPLLTAMERSAGALSEGRWADAVPGQQTAAEALAEVHLGLRIALAEAARRALEDHQQLLEGDLEWQRELERLKAGSGLSPLVDAEGRNVMSELVHLAETAAAQRRAQEDQQQAQGADYSFEEWMRGRLQDPGDGEYATADDFTLASTPSPEIAPAPSFADLPPSAVRPFIQETFEDVVGELLEEADLLEEQYMTYNLVTAESFSEEGHPGKGGYEAGRTSASAPTGNETPPTAHIGGASRSGRQGARSHGMTVGDESINRRGRDEVQEGHQAVPDQDGEMANIESGDPQADVSTGIGGKVVDHDDTHFSLADAGEWEDEMVDRLLDPKEKHNIVERQGNPLDHQVADLMRDMTSTQRQVIERLKVIRKELNNLYLPTDHLDEVIDRMETSLARLADPPGPDLFRMQNEALDLLRGTVIVFHGAHSGHFPSVPRDTGLQGRILDEPPWAPLPGYEDAVQRYYEKLAMP